MRRPLIAGNWKMNLDRATCLVLAEEIAARSNERSDVDLAVCPPSVYLDAVASVVSKSRLGLGAQNMYHEPSGAFTGELSGSMLLDIGCEYVILGHSERRHVLGETDVDVCRKVTAALRAELRGRRLTPIVCVGELLAEREAGETHAVIARQMAGSLEGLSAEDVGRCIIAYEPVWAIGTGRVATPEQAEEVHSDLRKILADRYNADVASQVRLLYGGSVKPDNAGQLMAQPNVDGALVGGASLKASDFWGIVEGAQTSGVAK